MYLLLSVLPILLPVFFLGVLNWPAPKGMGISAVMIMIVGFFFWKMPILAVTASFLQGIHKSLPIVWILFGALLLLRALEFTNSIQRINLGFTRLTTDMRLQAVIVTFLFGSLIEGVSGFGTPAMVTAPLLIALGFKPLSAVVLALAADSTASSFGAVGTPLTVGLSNTLSAGGLENVSTKITTVELISGTFLPLILIFLLVVLLPNQQQKNKLGSVLELAPWALLIGFCYNGIGWITQHFLGHEMVAIISSIGALGLAVLTIRLHFLLPAKLEKHPWQQTPQSRELNSAESATMPLWLAWFPYILTVILLVLPKFVPAIHHFLTNQVNLSWMKILGFKTINSEWLLLASPGTVLVLVAIVTLLIHRVSWADFGTETKQVVVSMKYTVLALVVTLVMVQVFTNSGINTSSLASMPEFLAEKLAHAFSGIWLGIAPLLGGLGSFVTGSTTVSTLTFAPVQASVAKDAGLDVDLVLALQVIGASIGNMICIHNIVAVSGVVGLTGKEGQVLRENALPVLFYFGLLLVAIMIVS